MTTLIPDGPTRGFAGWALRGALAIAAGVLALAGGAFSATSAMASPNLISSEPAPNSEVSALPEMYILQFDAPMNVLASEINVYDPTGFGLNEGPLATLADGYALGMISHFTDRPYGTYVVTYDVESRTGDRIAGSYAFVYADPNADAEEPAPAETVVATVVATATPMPTPVATQTTSPTIDPRVMAETSVNSGGDVNLIMVIGFAALGLGVLAVIVLLIVLLARKRKQTKEEPTKS